MDPVKLIVKAPNQHATDQMVQCELTWTIKQLKFHLSSIYTDCKPEEQKLIYSGQLLQDGVVLKDVLRLFDGQETHTVHLVYTPKPSSTATSANTHTMEEDSQSGGLRRRNVYSTSNNVADSTAPSGSNTLPSEAASPPPGIQLPVEALYSQPFPVPTMMPDSATNLAIYQQWYQHQYMQYVNQYMAYMTSLQQQNPVSCPIQATATNLSAPVLPDVPVQEAAAPQPQQRFPIMVHEPERVERDWLDYVNTTCRIVFLLLMIYFYSSTLRFMIVLCAIFALFLYRNRRTIFQPVNPVDAAVAPARPAAAPLDHEQDNANPDNNNNNLVNRNANDAATDAPEQNNPTTVLSFLRTFVSTFFSSLLPEPALAP